MQCPIKECKLHDDCTFLEILGIAKTPKSADKCTFFRKEKEVEKEKPASVNGTEPKAKQSKKGPPVKRKVKPKEPKRKLVK